MRKGITMITLVVTIVVLIILTSLVVNNVIHEGYIRKANETVFLSDLNTFINEFESKKANKQMLDFTFDETTINAQWGGNNNSDILVWIPSFDEKYSTLLKIVNGQIVYYGTNENESGWASTLNVSTISIE